MAKQINIGDLVWAKMKGFPPWPGRVIEPPENEARRRKNSHYIFFFGTEDHAWVQQDYIQLHSKEVLEKYNKKRGGIFLKAIKIITDLSKEGGCTTPDEDFVKNEESEKTDESCSSSIISEGKSESSIVELPDFIEDPNHLNLICDEENETAYDTPSISLPYPGWFGHYSSPREFVQRPATPPFNFDKSEYLKEKKIVPINKIIGFLGFSKIAQGIMKNLAHSGHSILLWDKTPDEWKRFADTLKIKIASSPTDVVKAAHYIFCCSSDAEFPREIHESILRGIELSTEKKGYIEMTPMDTKVLEMLACEIKLKGAQYLEAAYFGSISNANEGTLFITAAGDRTLYDECKTCLDAISKHHMFVSAEEGTASKYNHIFNMFLGTVTISLAESLKLLEKRGQGKNFIEILKLTNLNSSSIINMATAMMEQNYETDTPLKDIYRSFYEGLQLGNEVSQQTATFATVKERLKECISEGYGDHDITAVFESIKE